MAGTIFKTREFLNDESNDHDSFISITLSEYYGDVGYDVKITDCESRIRIHDNIKSKNGLRKLNVLINNLQRLVNEITQLNLLDKVYKSKYDTEEQALKGISIIREHYSVQEFRNQYKVKEDKGKFVIYRDHKVRKTRTNLVPGPLTRTE